MLSVWLLYSGVFAGYWVGRKDAFTSNTIAVAVAVIGCLTGFWMVVQSIPDFVDLARRGRINSDAVGATVAAGLFVVGAMTGMAWGRLAKP